MRVFIFIFLGSVLLFACRNEREPSVSDADSTADSRSEKISSPPYSVEVDEETQNLSLVRSNEDLEGAGVNDIIGSINKKYKDIELDLVKEGKDTISLKIDDARKLTQSMGSAGAEAYLAELTFSLTELKGIKAVKIDFEEGDHAMPGVYTRDDFKTLADPAKKK
jgi:hypothetical protein